LIQNRITFLVYYRRPFHGFHHFIGDVVGGLSPNIDDFIVFFTLSDETFGILLSDLFHLFFGLFDDFPFSGRCNHGVD